MAEKTVSEITADFMKANGYKVDYAATNEVKDLYSKQPGVVRTIYKNDSGKYACVETDGKSYVALSPAKKAMTSTVQIQSGGRVPDAANKTTDELTKRLAIIAKDKGIPLAAMAPEKREKATL
jgi:hypothetical protein